MRAPLRATGDGMRFIDTCWRTTDYTTPHRANYHAGPCEAAAS